MKLPNKAIVPVAGLATRYLPLSKVVPKEMWPLVDRPLVEYIVKEAIDSGMDHLIFVVNPERNLVSEYFKRSLELEKILTERKKEDILKELHRINDLSKKIKLSFVPQDVPLGDGDAILQAKRLVGKEACGVLFVDDIVISKTPCLAQLTKVFKTCQRPVLALKKVERDKIKKYGVVQVEKIASKLYKIKKIVEKPDPESAPSELAIVGKYIITQEIFEYLAKIERNGKREIILADALNNFVSDGGVVYGYEFEGEWLECGDKEGWLKSNLKLASTNWI